MTFVLGTLPNSQPYSKEKWKTGMDLNLERIRVNLFQTWFKLQLQP
jgi:hypothetical protein